MLPGRRSDNGALFANSNTPGGSQVFSGGFAMTPLGALYIFNGTGPRFVGGHMVTDVGQLCVAPGAPISRFVNGLPVTAEGRLIIQLNTTIGLYDSYVGGIRVGPNGGVYCIDLAPPPEFGFSNGFSNGYDIQ